MIKFAIATKLAESLAQIKTTSLHSLHRNSNQKKLWYTQSKNPLLLILSQIFGKYHMVAYLNPTMSISRSKSWQAFDDLKRSPQCVCAILYSAQHRIYYITHWFRYWIPQSCKMLNQYTVMGADIYQLFDPIWQYSNDYLLMSLSMNFTQELHILVNGKWTFKGLIMAKNLGSQPWLQNYSFQLVKQSTVDKP